MITTSLLLTSTNNKYLSGVPDRQGLSYKENVMANNNDIVNITCYRKTEQMSRDDAILYYSEAESMTDGHERQRYANILRGLRAGLTDVTDED